MVEEMYVYYTLATVHAVASSKSIRLFVDMPLKATDRYLELCQVHSLPFLQKDIGKFIMIVGYRNYYCDFEYWNFVNWLA
jgi:hypothetical protein